MPMQQTSSQRSASLTDDQKTFVSDTLSEYDVDNLTEEQAQTIVDTLAEAGIPAGSDLANVMNESGFDARAIGDMAGGPEGNRPPPPPPPSEDSQSVELTSMVDYVAELVAKELDSEEDYASLSQESIESIYADVAEKFALEEGQSILDVIV
jgi:hypothetical protein